MLPTLGELAMAAEKAAQNRLMRRLQKIDRRNKGHRRTRTSRAKCRNHRNNRVARRS